jgi:hypothetical protein
MNRMLTVLLLLGASTAFAECIRPTAPTLPDGEVAELEAMVAGQKAVKAYVAETEAYLDCLNAEDAAGGDAEPAEAKMARIDEHNSAVDEMESVATTFNEEIKEYKEKAQ